MENSLAGKLVLGIDTGSQAGGIAVVREEELLGSYKFAPGEKISEGLLTSISELIRQAGARPRDIGLIAAITGPGSLTGVRIGLSVAVGLARGLGVGCLGVSAFDAILETAGHSSQIAAVVRVSGNRLGWRLKNSDELSEIEIGTPLEMVEKLRHTAGRRIVCAKDASDKIQGEFDFELEAVENLAELAAVCGIKRHLEGNKNPARPLYIDTPAFRKLSQI